MLRQIEVICKCPTCCRTYVQAIQHKWIGKTHRVRRYEVALYVRCESNGQRDSKGVWAGLAYCVECSVRQAPPALKELVRKWCGEGEVK